MQYSTQVLIKQFYFKNEAKKIWAVAGWAVEP
jgi:hypothetical protein